MQQEEIDKLREEISRWQLKCRTLEDENERQREEMRSLETEIEEMHDNFKEEESEQFEQVKQELDVALKNCKILQIKLNKSERQYSQLEQVKSMLEKQVIDETTKQQQQTAAKNDNKLSAENQQTKFFEMVQTDGKNFVELPTHEYDQLLRDLNDLSERERDLQEQIKYSQEEAQLKGERLQAVEGENEVLLSRINKLTNANSSLRSTLLSNQRTAQMMSPTSSSSINASDRRLITDKKQTSSSDDNADDISNQAKSSSDNNNNNNKQKFREFIEQNEQLKLALELAQSDNTRLRAQLQQAQAQLNVLREKQLENASKLAPKDPSSPTRDKQTLATQNQNGSTQLSTRVDHELECRQLRARLVHNERELRQLRSQLESFNGCSDGSSANSSNSRNLTNSHLGTFRSRSMEDPTGAAATVCSSKRCQQLRDQLSKQNDDLNARVKELQLRLTNSSSTDFDKANSSSQLESDLLETLKKQLDFSENELAKARSRLVELDIECSKAQRHYKRLLDSFESCGSAAELQVVASRRLKLPSEPMRDAMSRAEMRQALRDLEADLDEMATMVRAKDCLVREQQQELSRLQQQQQQQQQVQINSAVVTPAGAGGPTSHPASPTNESKSLEEQQVKSLRRILEQEQMLSSNLKLDVANLEQECNDMMLGKQMLERERVAMEEELDRLRKLIGEFRAELEDSQQDRLKYQTKSRELSETVEKLRLELKEAKQQKQQSQVQQTSSTSPVGKQSPTMSSNNEILVLTRDLSELKVKNGFLMRQLEMAQDDAQRQLDELKDSHEIQLKRAIELAQIEMKEKHLIDAQQVRDELNETKQKLANLQRQMNRHEEELRSEQDRCRAIERDWRRDKSQWQQMREQMEAKFSLERRSSEFKLREMEVAMKEKDRSNISLQERCVQLERDCKRLQNKLTLLEEDTETRLKSLSRDLEFKSKEVLDLSGKLQTIELRNYEQCRKINDENKTLSESMKSLRETYESKLHEARQLRDMLAGRQEQSYRERQQSADQLADLTRRLNEALENETQAKLLRQRLEIQERQLESTRRELAASRDDRIRLKARCDELEKRELITKTTTISSSSASSFLRPFVGQTRRAESPARSSSPNSALDRENNSSIGQPSSRTLQQNQIDQATIEKLSGKINDQRNLIQMLRQQLGECQMELKQIKLLQTSERSKWQTRVAILTSRLNECEEKLAFEMNCNLSYTKPSPNSDEMRNNSQQPVFGDNIVRAKLEMNFDDERQSHLALIQQQQAQIDSLARDLKKVSQAHDMLRLHSKQLESNNNKLSKKLIEYQQQQPLQNFAQRELELRHEKLTQINAKLRAEVRPMIVVVDKILASLDAPEQIQINRSNDSTNRPLRAPRESNYDSDSQSISIKTLPAVPMSGQSRLSRLLGGKSTSKNRESIDEIDQSTTGYETGMMRRDDLATTKSNSARKPVKRVRIKCSSIGITTSEKKQLKQNLKILTEILYSNVITTKTTTNHNDATISIDNLKSDTPVSSLFGHRTGIQSNIDSDLESEHSCSSELGQNSKVKLGSASSSVYKRFPQSYPKSPAKSGAGSSLTDYESESSLTSDFVTSSRYSRKDSNGAGGAESDSGISPGSQGKRTKLGLGRKMAGTLRNISRSIQGLGSSSNNPDASETEQRSKTSDKSFHEIRV